MSVLKGRAQHEAIYQPKCSRNAMSSIRAYYPLIAIENLHALETTKSRAKCTTHWTWGDEDITSDFFSSWQYVQNKIQFWRNPANHPPEIPIPTSKGLCKITGSQFTNSISFVLTVFEVHTKNWSHRSLRDMKSSWGKRLKISKHTGPGSLKTYRIHQEIVGCYYTKAYEPHHC